MSIPKFDDLFQPLLKALHELGGSASNDEIDNKVAEILNLSEDEINEIHRGNRTKLSYRLAWARNYLKNYGLLENSSRGIWRLSIQGQNTSEIDKRIVVKSVRDKSMNSIDIEDEGEIGLANDNDGATWQDNLIDRVHKMSPQSFEKLCQRILRESGFVQVEVVGRSGDGGIDGKGILRMNGLLSFHIIFQSKRYQNSVSSKEIRDFRGAMQGRADKGLFITTSTFTRDAKIEATRDGAPPIDLIDGNSLAEKMKELELGVKINTVENVKVDETFFEEYK